MPEEAELKLHFIEGIPLCRLIRVSLQIPSPLLLIQRDHIPWCVHTWLVDHGSLNTGKFTRRFHKVLALLLNFQLQLLKGSRLHFSLRIAFGVGKPFTLLLPIYPIWSFHSGEHSQAITN